MSKRTQAREAASRLGGIAAYFLKLGFLGFGGPLALIAAMQADLVEARRWVAPERFGRMLALIKTLPGPTATQIAIALGQARGGKMGGLIAGALLILPAFVMMTLLAAFFSSIERVEWTRPLLMGMQAAAIGVIAESVWRLSAPYRRERAFWAVAVVAAGATFAHPSIEPVVILGAGLAGLGMSSVGARAKTGGAHAVAALPALGWVHLKAGAFVFGTGLAIVPLLAHDVVDAHHWLTRREFLDALAFGQVTPGPVTITATFIGYKVAGMGGAILATGAIFAPAFFNILTWFPIAERRFDGSRRSRAFTMWALAAVIGAICVSLARLAGELPRDFGGPATAVAMAIIGANALLLALRTRCPVWVIIPSGGILGTILEKLW